MSPRNGKICPNARQAPEQPLPRLTGHRLWPLAAVGVVGALIFAAGWHQSLSLETLVRHRMAMSAFVADHIVVAIGAFLLLYVVVVALSIPGATILTVAGGALFGAIAGGIAALAGATLGAAFIFLIARGAIGEYLTARAGPLLAKFARGFHEDAFNYLLFLRLVPVFPFWLVNLAPALLGVRFMTFLTTTALGILPGTFAFAFVGSGLDSVITAQEALYRRCLESGRADCRINFDVNAALTPRLFAAFVVLGLIALIPVAVRRLRARTGRV